MALPFPGKLNQPLVWILGLMGGGILFVGATTYFLAQAPNPELELEKLTVPVERETLRLEIKASGTVEPIQSVNVSPKNPGIIAKLGVEQGMRVKKGQPLAIMDNLELQAQRFQAKAKFEQAVANFEEARIRIGEEIKQAEQRVSQTKANVVQLQERLKQRLEGVPREINQAKGDIVAAESRFKLALERIKRYQGLQEEGAVTRDRLDEAQSEYRNAEANLFQAQQRFAQAENTAQPEIKQIEQEIMQLIATVDQAQSALTQRQKTAETEIAGLKAAAAAARGELARIEVQLNDTIIRAPFDGIVTQRFATEGAFVTPTTSASNTASATSTSIFALARGLEVVARVPEVDIGQLQLGQPVSVIADAYPDEIFEGRVRRIAPEAVVENNVTSFEVTIALKDQEKLLSKMNVDAIFLGNQVKDALVIPTVAVVTEKGKQGVMVPDQENKPKFKPIKIGLSIDDKTQILDGLAPGERVFIDLPDDQQPMREEL